MGLHPDTVRRIREFFGAHRCKCGNVAARFCNGRFYCAGHFVPARGKRDETTKVRQAAAGRASTEGKWRAAAPQRGGVAPGNTGLLRGTREGRTRVRRFARPKYRGMVGGAGTREAKAAAGSQPVR